MGTILTIILFLFILGLLVFVHELGHFIAAKKLGIRVEEFAFGFKPRLWAIKRGETNYAINAIPLGGYLSMYGEEKDQGKRSFMGKPRWARAIVLVGGVVMNFLLAWLVFTVIFITGFEPLVSGVIGRKGVEVVSPVKITEIEKKSPAEKIGLKKNDEIISVDGTTTASALEVIAIIYARDGKPVKLVIERNSKEMSFDVTPRKNPAADSGPIGIGMTEGKIGAKWYNAPIVALREVGRLSEMTVGALGNFVKKLFVKQEISQDVTGMVGVGVMTDFVRRLGLVYVLQWIALISLSLAIMNLLPIVPLDGGHLFLVAVESVRKKKLTDNQMQWFGLVGFGLIILLVLVTTYSDVMRFSVWDKFIGLFK